MVQKNEVVRMEILDMNSDGNGVGRHEGMAVFVPGSAVGDILDVRIVKVLRTYCFGRIEQVVSPSPDRIVSSCPAAKRCGGCVFRHVSYEAELRYKHRFVEQNMRRIGKIDLSAEPVLPSPQEAGYRNKAQYPVRMQQGQLCAGFFAPRSHEVVDCRDCALQPPQFGQLLREILAFVQEHRIPAYDEASGKGLLRHLYLRQGAHSHEMMVCLVINGDTFPKAPLLVQRLRDTAPSIASILLNINKRNTNVILGEKNRVLYGSETIADTMCGLVFRLSPHAFYQVNTPAAERLYELAAEYADLSGRETLLDLYCGVGTIGLSMASKAAQLIGVEAVPQAVENARANAAANGVENARFLCADASDAAAQLAKEGVRPDVVMLDPPRKGCDAALLHTVAGMKPDRIVYISCNSATLARDCTELERLGYLVQRYRPVDLFPRTAHVECCTLLQRSEVVS